MPAPQAEVGGVPRTELQELQLKAQEQTDEVSYHSLNPLLNSWCKSTNKKVSNLFHRLTQIKSGLYLEAIINMHKNDYLCTKY